MGTRQREEEEKRKKLWSHKINLKKSRQKFNTCGFGMQEADYHPFSCVQSSLSPRDGGQEWPGDISGGSVYVLATGWDNEEFQMLFL